MRSAFQSAERSGGDRENQSSSVAWRWFARHGSLVTGNFATAAQKKSHRLAARESLRIAARGAFTIRVCPGVAVQSKKGGTMSASQAIKHARAVRQRLRHPRNAVADHGIDLKRKPVLTVIEPAPPAPDTATLPLGSGTPLPDHVLS